MTAYANNTNTIEEGKDYIVTAGAEKGTIFHVTYVDSYVAGYTKKGYAEVTADNFLRYFEKLHVDESACVKVICYNKEELWAEREAAMAFYDDGMMACEGCESERYMSIWFDLRDGKKVCTDF